MQVKNLTSVLSLSDKHVKTLFTSSDTELDHNWQVDWTKLLESTEACSIDLHPELSLGSAAERKPTLLYLEYRDDSLTSLAVLKPKEIKASSLPVLGAVGKLAGFRLVGNQLLGIADDAAADRFLITLNRLFNDEVCDCIYVEDLDLESPLYRALKNREDNRVAVVEELKPAQAHHRICFPQPGADYWQSLSKKSRYKIRRSAKDFEHEVKKYAKPEAVEEFLQHAATVSSLSWQAKRLGQRVHLDEHSQNHYGALAKIGAMRCYVMLKDSKPIAFVCGWQWNGRYEYEEIAYDSAFSVKSPGKVLLFRILEDLIAEDTPKFLDFGAGDAEYKQVFSTHTGSSAPIVFAPKSTKVRIWQSLSKMRRITSSAARRVLKMTGLYEKARRAYRNT